LGHAGVEGELGAQVTICDYLALRGGRVGVC